MKILKSKSLVLSLVLITLLAMCFGSIQSAADNKDPTPTTIPQGVDTKDNANDSSVNKKSVVNSLLDGIGDVVVKDSIVVNGKKNLLYKEFENPKKAIEDLKKNSPTFIDELKNVYGLHELSDSTFQNYQDAMNKYIEGKDIYSKDEDTYVSFKTFRAFCDIYENSEQNQEILRLYSLYKNNEVDSDKLAIALPYNSPIANEFSNNPVGTRVLGFDVDDGCDYATTWYGSRNTPTYKSFSADCTNFTSQILEAGGVAQEVYNDENMGWWHTRDWLGIHHHSISFIRADTFARYMGVSYDTTSNYSFSGNIQRGDFIAADWTDDGEWNHMGFVVYTGTYDTYGDLYYRDYAVAQHTTDYFRWASWSDCSWDEIEGDGGRYGRVRR